LLLRLLVSDALKAVPVPCALLALVPPEMPPKALPLPEFSSVVALLSGAAPKIKTPTAPLMPA
jgi:hypothetical protein